MIIEQKQLKGTPAKAMHYEALDGVRAYAIMGIVLMHVRANGKYAIDGFVYNTLITSFTNFVFLFMTVSAFGMCCGYYDKILNQKITVEQFYTKRYQKIWPFFAALCMLDLFVSPSIDSVYEVFANLTLCFGLLPNANIEVIGVGWTLGVIFVFYMLFPFFCYLLANRKRAWLVFAISIAFNVLCQIYFFDTNHMSVRFRARANIVYSAVYFFAGGLIYLYRDKISEISKHYWRVMLGLCGGAIVIYFAIGESTMTTLLVSVALLIYALGDCRKGILINPVMKFLGGISFEIYLCHMVSFRILEKLHLTHVVSNELIAYCITAIGTIAGAIIFSVCARWLLSKVGELRINRDAKI